MARTAHETSAAADQLDETLTQIAEEIESQLDALAARIADDIHAQMPEFGAEAQVTARTRAAVRANLAAFTSIMRGGVPTARVRVAEEALDYARTFVHRGLELALVLRCYRLGHALMWRLWSDAIDSKGLPAESRAALVGIVSTSMFEFIDQVTADMVDEYLTERARWARSAEALRAETVDSILTGKPVDLDAAGRVLGYELRRWHVGMLVWEEPERPGEEAEDRFDLLRETGERVAEQLGSSGRPLALAAGNSVAWVWAGLPERIDEATLDAAVGRRNDEISVALGEPADGLEGFRCTHEHAALCRRVMRLKGLQPGAVQRYSTVALPALLTKDLDQLRGFVSTELGPLAGDDEATARLRATLLIYMEEGLSAARTGRRVGIHTNTANYRVRRCEELLGRSVRERQLELQVALLVRESLRDVTFE